MPGYLIIRLGADSEAEIGRLNAVTDYSAGPLPIEITCRQVPLIDVGDVAIIWLGSNSNKGSKTPWIQGIRGVGKIQSVLGDEGYNVDKTIGISACVVLPRSVTKMDIVQSDRYKAIAAMPVLGVNNYSSQVVQRIDPSEPAQSMRDLFAALEETVPGFAERLKNCYPDLGALVEKSGETNPEPAETSPVDTSRNPDNAQDADGLDADEERGSEIEVPFDPMKIDIIVKPMTISSLEDRLANGELDLTPDFQRQANVWDSKRKARLIESILLRIPLPSFYFSEDADGGYAVVDGLQRLCAVFHFKQPALLNAATKVDLPPLRLKGLQYLKELEGRSYEELDRKFQRRISELEITANIIRANTPSAVKFNVFARLNQGGLPLNAQEIRNAIFPGDWRNELRNLAESQNFVSATEGKVQTSRQQDMELVLRYVALWQLGPPFRRPSGQNLDEFLNATVEQVLVAWPTSRWQDVGRAFHDSISLVKQLRGKHAFRKSAGASARKPINRGLFEAELISLGSIGNERMMHLMEHKALFEQKFVNALNHDNNFIQALLYGTGSAESSNARIEVLTRIVREILHA